MPPRTAPEGREYRYITTPVELRADGDGPRRLTGHAAVFNTDTAIGPEDNPYWIERIAPGAFRSAILGDDVRALFNHNPDIVLGRNVAATLRMQEDNIGLACEILPPDTQAARDVMTLIERGDVSQMSFGFMVRTGGQMWEEMPDGVIRRTIKDVILFDVSPVTFAAFPTTDIALREARSGGLVTRAALDDERERREKLQVLTNRLALAEMM